MKRLLPLLPRPSRYLGNEWGVVRKDPASVRARAALAFPDLYEVGMSYMGQRILYEAVNNVDGLMAERVFAPCVDTAAILREHGVRLATLETDTDLDRTDLVAFSLTHELCYTNVLYMLDLGGIPLRHADRAGDGPMRYPLILAGGGACFNPEPVAPFLDAAVLGDGERILPDILERTARARKAGASLTQLLEELSMLPGVYVPSFFRSDESGAAMPLHPDRAVVEKAVVPDLDTAPFPERFVLPFGKAVHDRMTVEIARGCTRGCRFCQAGMIYRPVRERGLEVLDNLVERGLGENGYEDLSFLSLSTGDFSALETLFARSFDRCRQEQVSISLPSLRVGSLSPAVMERIAAIRRTGATIAPEAGSQRLRDVINKGVTEEGLMEHVRTLFEHGWQAVKLYFMIGLPTETEEDLEAIADLCRAVRDAAGPDVKRLQVTAAVSPFVPKPHTPFQWERQIDRTEIRERLDFLRSRIRPLKRVQLKSHIPEMSFLEGVFSRGDRRLAEVLELAHAKGALFSSWKDHFDLLTYVQALEECGLDAHEFLAARDLDAPLPWDHLSSGVSKRFLLAERRRALEEKITEDCRYGACRNCGVCEGEGRVSELTAQAGQGEIIPRLNFAERDQESPATPPPALAPCPDLNAKGGAYLVRHEKRGPAAFLSQLEIQNVLERAMRRAGLPLSFSAGFHPMPRITFGRALSVGVESLDEWFYLTLRQSMEPGEVFAALAPQMPEGLALTGVEPGPLSKKKPQPMFETYRLEYELPDEKARERVRQWVDFSEAASFQLARSTKRGHAVTDVRPLLISLEPSADGRSLTLVFDWTTLYLSPLKLVDAINPGIGPLDYHLIKLRQDFSLQLCPPKSESGHGCY